ncbi:MAG: choice-of-anchor J domain-containing protein [Ginsengibacter sp.]
MKTTNIFIFILLALFLSTAVIISCSKDKLKIDNTTEEPAVPNASFVEEFDTVANLTSKGWAFRNNTNPLGQTGWRQGRYEEANQVKFISVGPYLGFPAYSAHNTPNDFVSCDVSCLGDASGNGGNISAWLISPPLEMKNGDTISFYSRATDDALYYDPAIDRMQVWGNFADGTADVGNTDASTGSFNNLLLDINPNRTYNVQGGYPSMWTKYTIVISGIPGDGSIDNGRFAFRYYNVDAGLQGGSGVTGNYYNPTVVGVDKLYYGHH